MRKVVSAYLEDCDDTDPSANAALQWVMQVLASVNVKGEHKLQSFSFKLAHGSRIYFHSFTCLRTYCVQNSLSVNPRFASIQLCFA
jgi:hypothetical protein